MRVVLEIVDGPRKGEQLEMSPGDTLSVGRTSKSQVVLAYDNFLSGLHFQVLLTDDRCLLRDNGSSNGTFVNEQRVAEQELRHRDQIMAGQTRFSVWIDPTPTFATGPRQGTLLMQRPLVSEITPEQRVLISSLRRSGLPVYGLLNTAGETNLRSVVQGAEPNQLLVDGMDGSPTLFHVPPDWPILPHLLNVAWGKNRMVFFTCSHPFAEVRRHLRGLYLLQSEDGRRFRLRLYDGRLLQAFLASASDEELTHVFGPVQAYYCEDGGRLIEYTVSPTGLRPNVIRLVAEAFG